MPILLNTATKTEIYTQVIEKSGRRYGRGARRSSRAGLGALELIIRENNGAMEGHCIWYSYDTDSIENSSYLWSRKDTDMVHKLGEAGSGRSAVEAQVVNFNRAVDTWRAAPTERKGEFAVSVLSNLGEVGGTLEEHVGEADAEAIRTDFHA